MIEWHDATDANGNPSREFRITRDGKRDITGALWLPSAGNAGQTLVCLGHGASGNRYQPPLCHLAARFTREAGVPVLSLDGPVHGLRQVGEGGRAAFWPEFRRDGSLEDMTEDWHTAIESVVALDPVGQCKLAYFGLSMGTIFGIPLVASRDDVTVATLGLFGVDDGSPHADKYMADASRIECPLLYLMQLEDELFSRPGYLRVFDAFASNDKRLHANPGLHPQMPAEEIAFAFDFMVSHIRGERKRLVEPLSE